MFYVVAVNPGDEVGFPFRPSKVYEANSTAALGKIVAQNLGAVTVVFDAATPVPDPYDPNRMLDVPRAERMVKHAFTSLRRHLDAKAAAERIRNVEADRQEYERRVAAGR